jgi:predicted AAA+ superfamily ATPase
MYEKNMAEANTRYPRAIAPQLTADLGLYPVVAVMGARQVGKSTVCQQLLMNLDFQDELLTIESARTGTPRS